MSTARVITSLLALAFCALAHGQDAASWPQRSVTIVVPFGNGSGMDILMRVLAPELSQRWGQPVVVENKPGAAGNIGAGNVAKAAPDGYTLLGTNTALTATPSLYKQLPFDPAADLVPVALLAMAPHVVVVNPKVFPVRSMAELIEAARSKPGQLNYASSGNGTTLHLAMELLKLREKLDIVHVPYKGQDGAIAELVSGVVQMMFQPINTALPLVRSGRVRALAVTGTKRSELLPDVPTFREQRLAYMDEGSAWYGVLVPEKTPQRLIAKIHADLTAAIMQPAVLKSLPNLGLEPTTGTRDEFGALIKDEFARWRKLIADANIKAQ
jgi:tripartite-type tricarboxylate transporter receptor subunit TctC